MAKLRAYLKRMLQNKQSSSIHKDIWYGWEGGNTLKKLAVLNTFAALLILSVALILFSGPAQAYVYDGFTSAGINTSLWSDTGPNSGLFSQPGDGYLYFSDANGGKTDRLRSYNRVSGAFFVAIQYSNFQSTSNQPSGQWLSSCVVLKLGDGTNAVVVEEGKNVDGQFFQADSDIDGTKTYLCDPFFTGVNSGWLGIDYNGKLGTGGQVTLWYDAGAGWTKIATYAPNFGLFSTAPYFSVVGYNPIGRELTFQVDQVQLTPPPLSPIGALMLLLD
jgi:hypothetical protein